MSVTENIIRIRNVTKVFQMGSESIHAVDNVSLNIHKEEVCCLFGKSGSGKSTLLNLIAGWKSRQKEGFCFTISTSNG